jgi:hypothetical protein
MTDITQIAGINYGFSEVDFIDFDIQRLLLHKLTQYGPSLATGDLNGDGLDDIVSGGGSPFHASIFFQMTNGKFVRKFLPGNDSPQLQDDAGIILLDADKDGDLDLFIVSGGAENQPQTKAYADHFYLNDGKGNFSELVTDFTNNRATKSAVVAADYDLDGDLDLFIGGRGIPGRYPMPTSSFIYQNNSEKGKVQFTDVTNKVAPELVNIGMVTAALWSDADADGKMDLFITKEWGSIDVFKNDGKKLTKLKTPLDTFKGWWNSIVSVDLDNDGDLDYIAGNFGTNSFLHATNEEPLNVYAKDFDNNFSLDVIFSHWIVDQTGGIKKEFPLAGRDLLLREMSIMKERFPNYASYAKTDMSQLLTADQLKDAYRANANYLQSSWIENKGNFSFEIHELPAAIQLSPVFGILPKDINNDGWVDVIFTGNEYSMSPYLGRQDALNGMVLLNHGKGKFTPLTIAQSGFYTPANGRALASLVVNGQSSLVVGQNRDFMKLFQQTTKKELPIKILEQETHAMIYFKNGTQRKEEFPFGQGFLSQSSRYLLLSPEKKYVDIFAGNKKTRTIQP